MFFHILNWSLAEATPGYRDAGQAEAQQKPRRAGVRDVAGDVGDGIGDGGTPRTSRIITYAYARRDEGKVCWTERGSRIG